MGRPSVKEQLIECSRALLIARGFDGASVADLVAAAGVPKGSFYNHFPSKEQFVVEHVRRYVVSLNLPSLREPVGSPLGAVRDHFHALVACRRDGSMPPGCLLGTLSITVGEQNADLLAAIRDAFEEWLCALAVALERARAAGEIANTADPRDLAAALIDGFEGAVTRAQVSGPEALENFLRITLVHLTV